MSHESDQICKFPSSNCTGCSVRLENPVHSIFKSEEDLSSFDKFMPLFSDFLMIKEYAQLCCINAASFLQFFLRLFQNNFCDDFNITDEIPSQIKYVFCVYLQ